MSAIQEGSIKLSFKSRENFNDCARNKKHTMDSKLKITKVNVNFKNPLSLREQF